MTTEQKATHTPGPWVAERFGKSSTYMIFAETKGRVADAYGDADAHLIAAAPALYEALKRITAGLSDAEDLRALIKGDEVRQARTAIAQAEGRAS
jgi:hypothetical protein